MSECKDEMQRECKHLCFHWVVLVDWMVRKEAGCNLQMCKAWLRVSENYLENERKRINQLTERVREVGSEGLYEFYKKVVELIC